MTRQTELFDPPIVAPGQLTDREREAAKKLARRDDPESSKAAAENMVGSGAAKYQEGRITDLVFMAPGSTAHELAAASKGELSQVQIMRRLSKIADVRQGDERKCRVSKRKSVTWWPK